MLISSVASCCRGLFLVQVSTPHHIWTLRLQEVSELPFFMKYLERALRTKRYKVSFISKYPPYYFRDTSGEAVSSLKLHVFESSNRFYNSIYIDKDIFIETHFVLLEIRRKFPFPTITLLRAALKNTF